MLRMYLKRAELLQSGNRSNKLTHPRKYKKSERILTPGLLQFVIDRPPPLELV